MHLDSADRSKLVEVFSQAQEQGWIGGRDIDQHIEHSLGFAPVVAAAPTVAVDLGSGGGLPALVLAAAWPRSQWTLVESSLPRAAFLEMHCAHLGWANRVVILQARAESLGEDEQFRGRADLVTARSFGSAIARDQNRQSPAPPRRRTRCQRRPRCHPVARRSPGYGGHVPRPPHPNSAKFPPHHPTSPLPLTKLDVSPDKWGGGWRRRRQDPQPTGGW